LNEAFDIVSCDDNQLSKRKLLHLVEHGNGVLFIGSGISRRLNYPSWEGVIESLANRIPEEETKELVRRKLNNSELLLAAEIVKNKLPFDQYCLAFEEHFCPKNPAHDDFHRMLVSLKFKGFVTTNYDPIIESALKSIQISSRDYGITISHEQRSHVHGFLSALSHSINYTERYQLFLHGKYNLHESTILSYGDYVQKYDGRNIKEQSELYEQLISGNISIEDFEQKSNLKDSAFRTIHYKAIYLLFATQRLVFAGFGLRDEYLNKIINDVQLDFNPFQPNHFALFSKNGTESWNEFDYLQKKREWNAKGVELVFYDDNETYGGIEEFVSNFPSDCFYQPNASPASIHQIPKNPTTTTESQSEQNHTVVVDNDINTKLINMAKKVADDLKNK